MSDKYKKEGDYTHIKMSQVIASAKMRLRIESGDDDIFLERYANEGARHFDSLNTFIKKECELEVVNGKAKLPYGFHQILSLDPCNGGNYVYVDSPWLKNNGVPYRQNFWNSHGVFQIQDGWIYFSLEANWSQNHGTFAVPPSTPCITPFNPQYPPASFGGPATNVQNGPVFVNKKIRIAYIGMNVDDDGMMTVYADMERGLVAYCVWMYMLDSPAGKYTQQQIQANELIWINQKSWYKSVQFQNDFRNTRRQVASLANAWITNKNWNI